MSYERLYKMKMTSLFSSYVKKVERKNHSRTELEEVIVQLTGYPLKDLSAIMAQKTVYEFFDEMPLKNTESDLVTGMICGIRVETIENEIERRIRAMDKRVDDLFKKNIK
ncbi:MAG: DUF2200 family protein [Acholeplasma sp.]|nr:DUF2200 family protein [Acholeplasma sp.]